MGALEYLQGYFKTNPTSAAILSGAIACFAAVVVIGTFGIDLQAKIPSVIFVVAIGVVFFLLVGLLDKPVARNSASWFLGLLIVGWIAAFFWSRLHPRDAELACAVYFWAPCAETADAIAADSTAKPNLTAPTSGTFGTDAKAKYQVFLQFAGYDRPTIVALAQALSTQGWNVQGRESGGERIATAARLAEVRYGDISAKPAAEALAAALNASAISSKQVKAVHLDVIKPSVFEVWIGQ